MLFLSSVLRRHLNLLKFYRFLALFHYAVVGWAVSFLLLGLFAYFIPFVTTQWQLSLSWGGGFLLVAWFAWVLWSLRSVKKWELSRAAEELERQSIYFDFNPEARSELTAAAHFLEQEKQNEFEQAHIQRWQKKATKLPVFLKPHGSLLLIMGWAWAIFALTQVMIGNMEYSLPQQRLAWTPSSYELKLPSREAEWEIKSGTIAGVKNSQFRFRPPELGPWQVYLFQRGINNEWKSTPCSDWCSGVILSQGRYAVGSLWSRSAEFPLQVLEDEEPRARIFVRDGSDLVPNPRLNILNPTTIALQLLASDDFGIERLSLVHRFEGTETTLAEEVNVGTNFRGDFDLSMEGWEGGTHEVFMRVTDQLRSIQSSPLVIQYADDEYLREQRNRNLRAYIDEWLHVLADLLESKEAASLVESLAGRLEDLSRPETYDHELFDVWVAEMSSFQARVQRQLVDFSRLELLPELIQELERQLLYGLSLLFQERAGDVNAAKDAVQQTSEDISKLLDDIREGRESLTSEKLQEAFERLAKQLEDLQDRLKNLPQGPQDQHINREALDEQISQSQELEDKIAEIQNLVSLGQDEMALRELESLLNQLSILNQEIERGLDQWEENLAQGAMQASEKHEKALEDLAEKQKQLLESTEEWRGLGESLDEQFMSANPEEQAELQEQMVQWQEEAERLAEQQDQLAQEFQQLSEGFEQALDGTEWETVFRSGSQQELERRIRSQMEESVQALDRQESFEAVSSEQASLELLRQAQEMQSELRDRVREQAEAVRSQQRQDQRVEIIESEGRGQRERRQRIMNSLRQEVDEQFQPSHERYFEELLQR